MNKNIIIITGHGHYASGIKSFLKEVAGEIPYVEFIDFNSELSADDLLKIFQKSQKSIKTQIYCLFQIL